MTPLTDAEIKDLLTATLHGSLPVAMQQRLMATAAECVELRAALRPFANAMFVGPDVPAGARFQFQVTATADEIRRAREVLT